MAIAELFTKKKIVDIKDSEDQIDKEYQRRLANIKLKGDLDSLLRDYEEFLPQGLQRLRDLSTKGFQELGKKLRAYYDAIIMGGGTFPAEPDEAIMLAQPVMLCVPRMFARKMAESRKDRYYTFGEAWAELRGSGHIDLLIKQQETMYHRVLEAKEDSDGLFETGTSEGYFQTEVIDATPESEDV